jgi:hypothetical protein
LYSAVGRRKLNIVRKTYSKATVCIKNPTWTGPESNLGLQGEWPTSNCISHDNPDVYINAIHAKSYLNILYFAL